MFQRKATSRGFASAALICGVALWCLANGAQRSVTVTDGIEMTELGDPLYSDGASACGRTASFAPDGKEFVVVLRRGDVRADINHYAMLLWRTAGLGSEPPKAILDMDSSSMWPAIDASTISWQSDSQSMSFLGEEAGGHHEVYRLNVGTGQLRALTSHSTSVMSYSRDSSGQVLAYTAVPPFRSLWDGKTLRNGFAVTTQYLSDLPDLITGRRGYFGGRGRPAERELFVQTQSGTRQIQPLRGSHFAGEPLGREGGRYLAVSPDGRYIVVVETVPYRNIPEVWHRYRDPVLRWLFSYLEGLPEPLRDTPALLFSRYVLVDVRGGQSRVLLESPVIIPERVVWAPDSASVIISDALLPIHSNDTQAALERESVSQAVEVNVRTGGLTSVGGSCSQAADWRRDVLTCEAAPTYLEKEQGHGGSHPVVEEAKDSNARGSSCSSPRLIRLRKSHGTWVSLGASVAHTRPLHVFLKEDMNTPPKLYWVTQGSTRPRLLYDLNPQFDHLKLGKVKVVSWEWSKGQRVTAGLYYPPDYRPGRRYPLVIQTHAWSSDRFWFFGPWTTAYAAQPLAARGMFVLQVNDLSHLRRYTDHVQLKDASRAIKIYRSAITYLSNQGLVDRRKVGIIGFSHTCFYVKWALTHEPDLFAAASVAEGDDGGYLQYITGQSAYMNDAPSMYGGAPFGQYLQSWVELSPSFNLDRVRTPLWINVLNPNSVLLDWEWFEGLRDLGKPVEMVMLDGRPHEEHLLQTPWDRLVSEGDNVAWFDFWLNGSEEPSPEEAAQFARWRALADVPSRGVRIF